MFSTLTTTFCKNCNTPFQQAEDEKRELCLDCQFPKNKKTISHTSRYISSEVKQNVWNRDGGKCVCCNSITQLEFDHIIPVSKGGSNYENNVQILCYDCNRKKFNNII